MGRRRTSVVWAALMALTACAQNVADRVQSPAPVASAQTSTLTTAEPVISPDQPPPPPVTSPDSIRPDTNVLPPTLEVARLDVYEIDVPQGEVSGSGAFWKHIEEPVVDVTTSDLLYENGVRTGEGDVTDWPYFKKIFDKAGADQHHSTLMAPSARSQALLIGPSIPQQRLFFFDRHGLSGRVYDDCRDFMVLSYQPAPRQPGSVRIELCPVVQSTEYHYTYDAMNVEQDFRLTRAEHLYDLNLTVDLPAGKFLVVAPSPDAKAPDSVGARFLTEEGPAVRMEQVLIVVADKPATLKAAGIAPVLDGQ